MNKNEFELGQLTREILYYETENDTVKMYNRLKQKKKGFAYNSRTGKIIKEYNRLKQKRDDILNDLSHAW